MSDRSPKVSVIIATYNYSRYIGDALNSVLQQTLDEWECIVVDDASADDTAAIVAGFIERDPRIRYFKLAENVGVSAARNHGLREARGEFIQLLDADDVLAPNKLQAHTEALSDHPSVSLVYSDFYHFSDAPEPTGKGGYRPDEKLNGSGDHIVARLIRGNVFRLNTVMFRRSVLQDVKGFRDEFRYVEDWDFWLRIAASGAGTLYIDDPKLACGVRITSNSLSKDLPAMRKFHLPVRQDLWTNAKLSIRNRLVLLVRYCDFLLQMLLVHREPIVMLKQGRGPFLLLVVVFSALLFPFWLAVSLLVRSWRK